MRQGPIRGGASARAVGTAIAGGLMLVCGGLIASETAKPPPATAAFAAQRAFINQKIAEYNQTFPEIRFAHLQGGERWHGEMVALVALLGNDAAPLDYEHPTRLREALMSATLERLARMLQRNIFSATTFRLPDNHAVGRPNLCVITLNPGAVTNGPATATQHMLGLSAETINQIHPVRYLDSRDHLEFALHHEAFHCLDTVLAGGAPTTHENLGGEYHAFRRESLADAFALAMHIRSHGRVTDYARNITHIRALCILTRTPDRCTFDTLREVLSLDPAKLAAMSTREVTTLAREVGHRTIHPYDDYVKRRVARIEAARMLGLLPRDEGAASRGTGQRPADGTLVGLMIDRHRYYFGELFTDTEIALDRRPQTESASH